MSGAPRCALLLWSALWAPVSLSSRIVPLRAGGALGAGGRGTATRVPGRARSFFYFPCGFRCLRPGGPRGRSDPAGSGRRLQFGRRPRRCLAALALRPGAARAVRVQFLCAPLHILQGERRVGRRERRKGVPSGGGVVGSLSRRLIRRRIRIGVCWGASQQTSSSARGTRSSANGPPRRGGGRRFLFYSKLTAQFAAQTAQTEPFVMRFAQAEQFAFRAVCAVCGAFGGDCALCGAFRAAWATQSCNGWWHQVGSNPGPLCLVA